LRIKFEVVGPSEGPWREGDLILWKMDEEHRPLLVWSSPTTGYALPSSFIAHLMRGLDNRVITIHSTDDCVRQLALLVVEGAPPPHQALPSSGGPLELLA